MKKGFLKLMTAAVVATGLASCSDDLGLSSNYGNGAKGDLTGHINEKSANFTRLGMSENYGEGAIMPWEATYDKDTNPGGTKSTWEWVFTEGDVVRAFSLQQMTWSSYDLISGFNTSDGVFKLNEASAKLTDPELYALTDAQFVYSVSPDVEGNAWLTYTIPYRYGAQTITPTDQENTDVRKFPAPFWGKAVATEAEGGEALDVEFNALTGFLRIESSMLPEGTKYIVLTTHGSAVAAEQDDGTPGDVTYDGFQLAEPQADGTDPEGFRDINSWWEEVDGSDNPVNAQLITDGNSEALSGTFTTMLVDDKSALGVDKGLQNKDGEDADDWMMGGISRLVTRDEIIIDLTKYNALENGVFWVPLIAQHYNNLHVIAATKLSKYAYRYIGNEIKHYTNQTVNVGDKLLLNVNVTNLGECDVWTLNKTIDEINKANKYGVPGVKNVINVDKLLPVQTYTVLNNNYYLRKDEKGNNTGTQLRLINNPSAWVKYPCDKIYVQGNGDLVVNIAAISTENNTGAKWGWSAMRTDTGFGQEANLLVSDLAVDDLTTRNYQGVQTEGNHRARINVPSTLTGMVSDLPTWNLTLAVNKDYVSASSEANLEVWAHGSKEKFTTGHNVIQLNPTDPSEAVLLNEKNAAIEVVNGINTLHVLEHTKGDVYVNQSTGAKTEITNALKVYSQEGLNVRIEDALVKNVLFPKKSFVSNQSRENWVITMGPAAIQKVGIVTDETSEEVPNNVTLHSYWTGKALDVEQPNVKDYDNGKVYTVAQLASAGEQISGSTTAEYQIPAPLVKYMWLGSNKLSYQGSNEQFDNGWIGAQVTIGGFNFDGNGVELERMYMPQNANGNTNINERTIWAYDPHFCCTTCGFNRRVASSQSVPQAGQVINISEWGLFRSIINSGDDKNLVENIFLHDVYADGELNNIGAIVGKVDAQNIKFENNKVGEIRIMAAGNYHGGMAGDIQTTGATEFDHNDIYGEYGINGIVKGNNYVGGLVGRIGQAEQNANATGTQRVNLTTPAGQLTINDTRVKLNNYITGVSETEGDTGGDFVGGLVGGAYVGDEGLVVSNSDVNVGKYISSNKGAVGGLFGEFLAGKAELTENSVETKDITAKNSFAGGIAGRGLTNDEITMDKQSVKAENIKTTSAEAYYVAGYIGDVKASEVTVKNAAVTVTGEISTKAQYAGGEFGMTEVDEAVNLENADIVVNTIKADEGIVGGQVAYANDGNIVVGKETINRNEALITNIDIEELSGAYAVGGVVGQNPNNSEVWIYTRRLDESATGDPKWYHKMYIDINEFTNTKTDLATYFKPQPKSEVAGSHSNVVGLLDGDLHINETFLYVNDHLDSDMKKAVGYDKHTTTLPTPGYTTGIYWGDYNGYVGVGKSGNFYLATLNVDLTNARNKVAAGQNDMNGYNLFKQEANYEDTSKNFGNTYEPYPAPAEEEGEGEGE